jgi:hypothetical protein
MRTRRVAVVVSMLVAALVGAAPASASPVEPGTLAYGSIGICRYEQVVPGESWLRRLAVTPPDQIDDAVPGTTYGWRFAVLRRSSSGITRTYRSPVQKRVANAQGQLAFRRMGVDVNAPQYPADYFLRIKVFAYADDGSVEWSRVRELDYYRRFIDGRFWYATGEPCWGHGWHNPV